MKCLHLVLFSHSPYYDEMYKLTREYYKKQSNVKTIYYAYSNTITDNFSLQDDILYIKGSETYVPGILLKTIQAFRYFESNISEYDYIIRSNISTIVNFELLCQRLQQYPIEYGGGLNNLQWLHPEAGVKDKTWFGTDFASGTCIIFSQGAFIQMMSQIHNVRLDIIDDLAIGILFREHIPNIKPKWIQKYSMHFLKCLITDSVDYKHTILYRNRTDSDRFIDVKHMAFILSQLSTQDHPRPF